MMRSCRRRAVLVIVMLLGATGPELAPAALAADAEKPAAQSGKMAGTVVEKGDNWIRVKTPGGESERFMPRWIGGMPADGGGLDKEMLAQLAKIKVGDKVELRWVMDERKRVVEIKVTESAPAGGGEAKPAPQSGKMAGTVVEKGDNWIRVKAAGGESERFMPRWIGGMPADGGGLDKEMLAQLAKIKVGDKVELRWVMDERKRVVEIKVLAE